MKNNNIFLFIITFVIITVNNNSSSLLAQYNELKNVKKKSDSLSCLLHNKPIMTKYSTLERIKRDNGRYEEVRIFWYEKIPSIPIPMFSRIYYSNGAMTERLNYLDTNDVKMPSNGYLLSSPKIIDNNYWVLPNFEIDLRLEFVDISTNNKIYTEIIPMQPKVQRWKRWEDVYGGIAIDLEKFANGVYLIYWFDNKLNELLKVDIVRRGCN